MHKEHGRQQHHRLIQRRTSTIITSSHQWDEEDVKDIQHIPITDSSFILYPPRLFFLYLLLLFLSRRIISLWVFLFFHVYGNSNIILATIHDNQNSPNTAHFPLDQQQACNYLAHTQHTHTHIIGILLFHPSPQQHAYMIIPIYESIFPFSKHWHS